MKNFLKAAFLIPCLPSSWSLAYEPARHNTPVLAELFTSEGCSSCPPADRLLLDLDRSQPVNGAHIIVLSEHVDYWNNLGWNDPFSSASNTERQREYAVRFDAQGVFTPQLIIDGHVSFVGSDKARANAEIRLAAERKKIDIQITHAVKQGSDVVATIEVPVSSLGTANVYLAVAKDQTQSNVKAGENAGHQLTHVAVLIQLLRVGTLKRGAAFFRESTVALPAGTAPLRLIAFLQDPKTLQILGATDTPL